MRILFLTKQQYMGKDLLADRFGRFFEIPRWLAAQGHQIDGVCLKYRETDARPAAPATIPAAVQWQSYSLGKNWPVEFLRHYSRLKKLAADIRPEVVVGASDSAHVILSAWLAKYLSVPSIVDLYDDFESYGANRIPFVDTMLARSVHSADGVAVVSNQLGRKIAAKYQPRGQVHVIANAVEPKIFRKIDKHSVRQELNLPRDGILVGTAGALSASRGVVTLRHAFEGIRATRKEAYLVLAGPTDMHWPRGIDSGVIYLGELAQDKVNKLFNALDVGVICLRNNAFGRACFPQKFFEMLAVRLPVVCARVGAMAELLHDSPGSLYDPDDVGSLQRAIETQLEQRSLPEWPVPTWEQRARQFDQLIREVLSTTDPVIAHDMVAAS